VRILPSIRLSLLPSFLLELLSVTPDIVFPANCFTHISHQLTLTPGFTRPSSSQESPTFLFSSTHTHLPSRPPSLPSTAAHPHLGPQNPSFGTIQDFPPLHRTLPLPPLLPSLALLRPLLLSCLDGDWSSPLFACPPLTAGAAGTVHSHPFLRRCLALGRWLPGGRRTRTGGREGGREGGRGR